MRRGARLLAGALLALVGARPAGAGAPRTFALLVGCTTYPFLARTLDAATYDAKVRLRGPAADVAALADVLTTTLGVPAAQVTTLVGWDDAAPLANPTRDNVLRGLVRLARTAAPGDRVVFLFAGHGSRVPDLSGDEPDGLDEVLLPADVRAFEPAGRRVPGAILDDEVGARLRAIRDAGATVWAVFDCCHAGTMARGGDGPTRARHLPATLLGAPATRGAPDVASGAADGDDLRGIAATYAVGPAGRAVEMRLPRGVPDAPWRGLLSFALAEDLRRTRGAGDLAALDARLAAAYDAVGFHGASPSTEGERSLAPAGPGAVTPLPRDLPALAAPDVRLRIARVDALGASLPPARDPFTDARFPWVAPEAADWLLTPTPFEGFHLRPAAWGGGADRELLVADDGPRALAALVQIARVENLVRLAAAQDAARTLGLTVRLEVRGPGDARPLRERGTVRPGDDLRIDVRNAGTRTLDVWVFLLDAGYGVSVLAPGAVATPRLRPGASFAPVQAFVTDTTLGVERVLVIAVPADEAAPPVDLRWLAAPPLEAARARARAPGGSGALADLLMAYAFPGATGGRGPGSVDARPAELTSAAWTTAWGAVRPPTWPAGPSARGARVVGRHAGAEGPRVATATAVPGARGRDLVFSGDEAVEVVGVDARGTLPPIGDAEALEQARASGALVTPIVLRLPADGPWEATYDTDLDGDPDLRLVDADHDGWAERQDLRDREPVGNREHDPWVPEDGTRVPWLRASYVAWPDDATAERAVRALRSLAP